MSYYVCNWSKYAQRTPTVVPAKFFLSNEDAETLWKVLNSNKTNTEMILNVLTTKTLSQRLEIVSQYQKLHNKNLIEHLKAKLKSDFENLIVAMLTPLHEYYAEELNRAIKGLGTDESDLIEILCTASNCELKDIRRAYHHKYQKTLESDIKGDTSGYFRDLLVKICSADRDRFPIFDAEEARTLAKVDADALSTAKDKRWDTFCDILCHRHYTQLVLIFEKFEDASGTTIEKAIENDFSGDAEKGLLAIVEATKNKAAFFAKRLHKSMKGLGTRDRDLIRLVVTRCEIDMGDIKQEYEKLYSKSLAAAIKDDTSGDYRKCLLMLIGEYEQN